MILNRVLNSIGIATVFSGFVLVSCNDNDAKEIPENWSEKAQPVKGWSQEDRIKAREEMNTVYPEMYALLGDSLVVEAYVDCYLNALESVYPNLEAVAKDPSGANRVSADCAAEFLGTI